MKKADIIDAYIKIRKIDNTIPDEVLDFMKDSAVEKLAKINDTIAILESCNRQHFTKCLYWGIQEKGCSCCEKTYKKI